MILVINEHFFREKPWPLFSYTQNGLLHMLDRNRRIKCRPEKFQLSKDKFDILITCEERVYDQVIEYMESRDQEENRPVHLINVDIQDNHEEATVGSFLIWELLTVVNHSTRSLFTKINDTFFQQHSNYSFFAAGQQRRLG